MLKEIIAGVVVLCTGTLWAQEIKVADNSSSGTYAQMLKELVGVCGNEAQITEVNTDGGAIGNLDKLVGNEVNLAFMHSDVLFYRAKTEDLDNLKTLVALFPEDVNIVALNKPYKETGVKGLMSRGRELDSISDLDGLKVGAAGGGYITSNVIRLQAEIPYTVVRFDNGKEVMRALDDGEIAAALFVGAAPLPNLKDLGTDYKILPINESTAEKLKAVYNRTTVTYTKMNPSPVPTVAPDCLLVTREYKTPKFAQSLSALRSCFETHLEELKETAGTHKAWQKVKSNNHGKWPWFQTVSK